MKRFSGWRVRVGRRCGVLAALLLASVVVAWTGPGAWRRLAPTVGAFSPTPAYTLSNLLVTLQRDPNDWLGRVVRVRAIAAGTPRWLPAAGSLTRIADMRQPRLVDAGAGASVPLLFSPSDRLLAALRRLPLIGPAVPSAQQPRWGEPAVYRIQIQRRINPACSSCYEAVLLDAAPGATLAPCGAIMDSHNCVQYHVWTSW